MPVRTRGLEPVRILSYVSKAEIAFVNIVGNPFHTLTVAY